MRARTLSTVMIGALVLAACGSPADESGSSATVGTDVRPCGHGSPRRDDGATDHRHRTRPNRPAHRSRRAPRRRPSRPVHRSRPRHRRHDRAADDRPDRAARPGTARRRLLGRQLAHADRRRRRADPEPRGASRVGGQPTAGPRHPPDQLCRRLGEPQERVAIGPAAARVVLRTTLTHLPGRSPGRRAVRSTARRPGPRHRTRHPGQRR